MSVVFMGMLGVPPSAFKAAGRLALTVCSAVVLPPLGRAPSSSQPFTELHHGHLPVVEEIARGLTLLTTASSFHDDS